MTLVSVLSLFLLVGCFGENTRKESTFQEINKAKTEAAVKGNDKFIQPPNNTNTNAPTYNITVEKGATINSPLMPPQPVPPPAEMKATPSAIQESSIERGLKDNSSNKVDEEKSSEVKSGWFYLLGAVAFCLVVGGLIALKIFYGREIKAVEETVSKVKGAAESGIKSALDFAKDELAWATPNSAEHAMAEKLQIKLDGVQKILEEASKKK